MSRQYMVTVAENGYIVHSALGSGGLGEAYVAESLEKLVDVFKLLEVNARVAPAASHGNVTSNGNTAMVAAQQSGRPKPTPSIIRSLTDTLRS